MTKLLVLYYSMYGHIERLAQAVAEGANRVNDVDVTIKRVPETMTPEAFAKAGGKQHQQAPVASPQELADYDGIIFGTPTRFGNMAGQMRTFLDQTALAAGIGFCTTLGAAFSFLAPLIRTEAEQRFHSPHAGPLVLAAFSLLCATLLWALRNRRADVSKQDAEIAG